VIDVDDSFIINGELADIVVENEDPVMDEVNLVPVAPRLPFVPSTLPS
jgi:hypothetical protein